MKKRATLEYLKNIDRAFEPNVSMKKSTALGIIAFAVLLLAIIYEPVYWVKRLKNFVKRYLK